jgi:hypothetical protein
MGRQLLPSALARTGCGSNSLESAPHPIPPPNTHTHTHMPRPTANPAASQHLREEGELALGDGVEQTVGLAVAKRNPPRIRVQQQQRGGAWQEQGGQGSVTPRSSVARSTPEGTKTAWPEAQRLPRQQLPALPQTLLPRNASATQRRKPATAQPGRKEQQQGGWLMG